jgi:hypothetical protein
MHVKEKPLAALLFLRYLEGNGGRGLEVIRGNKKNLVASLGALQNGKTE